MKVRMADWDRQVHVTSERSSTSVSTGRALRQFDAEITFETPRDDDVIEKLRDEDVTVTAIMDDGSEISCAAKLVLSSYIEGDPRRHYSLKLEEVEPLNLDSLEIHGELVDPDEYREDNRDGALFCTVKARVSVATLDRFWARRGAEDDRYFDVIRHGITEKPRRMRFGQILWQRLDDFDAEVRTLFYLVEKVSDDDSDHLMIEDPGARGARLATARNDIILDRLLHLLVDRSIVTAEVVEQIQQMASDEVWQRQKDYYRVSDLEDWGT